MRLTEAISDDAKMRATVDGASNADLGADVELVDVNGEDRTTLFSGWVSAGTLEGDSVQIIARTGPWLDEGRLPSWMCEGMTAEEMVWTLGRLAGLTPDRIDIPGFDPQPRPFLVCMPVAGIEIEDDIIVGQIGLTRGSTPPTNEMVEFVTDPELKARFLAPGIWAFVGVTAHTLLDAEQAGRLAVDTGLDRAALDALYPAVRTPDGRDRAYDRSKRRSDPRALPLVLVGGRDGRRWLRSLEPWSYDLLPARTSGEALRLPGSGPIEFDLALAAWRRAVGSFDPIRKAVALWEALEHYTEGTGLPKLFTPTERRGIEDRAQDSPALGADQRERITDTLRHLNDPTAIRKLRDAVTKDGFDCTDAEVAAADELRDARTSGVHGAAFEGDPAQLEKDLDIALGFTTRLLAHWGNQLSRRDDG